MIGTSLAGTGRMNGRAAGRLFLSLSELWTTAVNVKVRQVPPRHAHAAFLPANFSPFAHCPFAANHCCNVRASGTTFLKSSIDAE